MQVILGMHDCQPRTRSRADSLSYDDHTYVGYFYHLAFVRYDFNNIYPNDTS